MSGVTHVYVLCDSAERVPQAQKALMVNYYNYSYDRLILSLDWQVKVEANKINSYLRTQWQKRNNMLLLRRDSFHSACAGSNVCLPLSCAVSLLSLGPSMSPRAAQSHTKPWTGKTLLGAWCATCRQVSASTAMKLKETKPMEILSAQANFSKKCVTLQSQPEGFLWAYIWWGKPMSSAVK